MGFLSRDENNTELAIDYLKKAKAIFDKHGKTKDDAGSNKAVDVAIERIEKGGFKNNHSDFEETKKLKEENKTIKEKNVELLAINDSLKVTNKELLTRLDRIEKKLNDWEAKYGAKPGISENNNNKIPPPDNKKNVDDGKKEKIPDPEKQEKKQPPPPYDSKDSLSNNFVNNRYNEFVQKKI